MIALAFAEREEPLAPAAALGRGPVARALLARVLERSDGRLAALRGVGAPGLVCLLGDELPWVDGVDWLGRDPAAPSLLLPTALAPSAPARTLERALLARFPGAARPLAVAPGVVVPCGDARPLGRAEVAALLRRIDA